MDGYTISEAASVLGVSTERIWELIARGVLAAEPDGEEGMRVFLQPRATAASPVAEHRGNGEGERAARGGLNPFRELLTEFRHLTERYGQALLALGEARGEVASLRNRVDLLEARMDLRLPPAADEQRALPAWTATPVAPSAERQVEPVASVTVSPIDDDAVGTSATTTAAEGEDLDAEPERAAKAEEAAKSPPRSSRRRRLRSGKVAVSGIAEALARADDPSVADVPGAEADVVAETTPDVGTDRGAAPAVLDDAGEPELARAEPDASGEAAPEAYIEAAASPQPTEGDEPPPAGELLGPDSPYSAALEEPDWLSEDDLAAFAAPPAVAEEDQEANEAADEAPAPSWTDELEPTGTWGEQSDSSERAASAEISETEAEVEAAAAQVEVEPFADVQMTEEVEPAVEVGAEAAGERGEAVEDAAVQEPRGEEGVSPPVEARAAPPDEVEDERASALGIEPPPVEPAGTSETSEAKAEAEADAEPREAAHPDEEAVMWLGFGERAQDDYAAELEVATPGWRGAEHEPRDETTVDEAQANEAPAEPAPAQSKADAEEAQWHPGEMEAIRALLARSAALQGDEAAGEPAAEAPPPTAEAPPPAGEQQPPVEQAPADDAEETEQAEASAVDASAAQRATSSLPGAEELGEALAALDAIGGERPQADEGATVPSHWPAIDLPPLPGPSRKQHRPIPTEPPRGSAVLPLIGGRERDTTIPEPQRASSEARVSSPEDLEWLREVRSPAARAYRRLRRIFPG